MNKITRIAVIFALILALLTGTANVCLAVPIPSGFSVWDTRITNELNKSWMIKFNGLPATDTVNSGNIYILDSDNRPVAVTLSISGDNAAVISPAGPFTAGKEYRLYVTKGVYRDAGSQTSVPLSQPLVMPFIIAKADYLQSIRTVSNSLVTDISVAAKPLVHSVSINDTNMLYQGNNKFKLGVVGLTSGSKVVVKAYDSSGSLLQTLDYTVK